MIINKKHAIKNTKKQWNIENIVTAFKHLQINQILELVNP